MAKKANEKRVTPITGTIGISIVLSEQEAAYLNTLLIEGPLWEETGKAGKFFEGLWEELDAAGVEDHAYTHINAH